MIVFRLHGNEPEACGEIAAEAILPGGQGCTGSSGSPGGVGANSNWSAEQLLEVESYFSDLSKELSTAGLAFTAKVETAQMKKLLFINGHLITGGVEKSLLDILKHLDYEKFEVDLLLLEELGDYASEIPE